MRLVCITGYCLNFSFNDIGPGSHILACDSARVLVDFSTLEVYFVVFCTLVRFNDLCIFYFIYTHYYYYVPLQIWRINTKYNVLYVHGPCIPGPNHCYVRIMDTTLFYRKHAMEEQPPYMPTFYPEDAGDSALPEEILDEKLFNLKDPSILYEEEMKVVKKAKR